TEKKELAVPYYARLVREYPLSPLVPAATDKLKALKAPVPQPDPQAVAWMTAEKNAPRKHDPLVLKPLALVHSNPRQELSTAAKSGTPTMSPESGNEEGVDILAGNQSRIPGSGTGIVATVQPGGQAGTAETTGSAESVGPPSDGSEAKPQAQQPDSASAPASDPAKTPSAAGSSDPPKMEGTADATRTTDGAAAADGQSSDGTKTDSAQAAGDQTGNESDKTDSKKESSSKKKKGLKKIIPW
ncbi:MAG TPA: hypothetical protein VF748_16690, partial [Candidatus Acidoferrum sp.]